MTSEKLKIVFLTLRVFSCIFAVALLFASYSHQCGFSSSELLDTEKSFARTETQISSPSATIRYQLACRNLMLKTLNYRFSKLSSKDRLCLLDEQFDLYDSVQPKNRDYAFETHGSGASMQFYLDQARLFKQHFHKLIEDPANYRISVELNLIS